MNSIKKKNSDIEYHPKLAILRISILLLIIFSISYFFIMDNKEEEVKKSLSQEIIFEEIFSDTKPLEDYSKGAFYSVREGSTVEGEINLIEKEDGLYIQFTKFKITKNPNLKLILSTDRFGNKRIDVSDKLLGNVGNQEYILPENINFDFHKYLIFWDKSTNEVVAYTEIKYN